MDRKDEFSKWLETIDLSMNCDSAPQAPEKTCGCSSWECRLCFPELGQMGEETSLDRSADDPMELMQSPMEDSGDYSPLSMGDKNLSEIEQNDTPDWDADPMAVQDYHREMSRSPSSEREVEAMMNWASAILDFQRDGRSHSDHVYSDEDFEGMSYSQMKQAYKEVTGNINLESKENMKDMDPDVAAMLETLKKYDTQVKEANAKPDFLDVDKDGDKEEAFKKAEKEKDAKPVTESSGVDPEVLEWMSRFAKLGNMKGYGR
jgi:hypothetical protein